MAILVKMDAARAAVWKRVVEEKEPQLQVRIFPDVGAATDIEYLVAWEIPERVCAEYPNLRVIFVHGAGVDHLNLDELPAEVSVVRMVEPGISRGMTEWVVMAVLSAHRNLLDYIEQKRLRQWKEQPLVPANRRTVGVMGTGVLGQAALAALSRFGFRLRAWSRNPPEIPDTTCFAGAKGLPDFLSGTDILLCMLPSTPETQGVLNKAVFNQLPRGAVVINVSRGRNLDEAALLAALDEGQLSGAILDVTAREPLPSDNPLWDHPRVLITPHIATRTQPETAAEITVENIRRHRAGSAMANVVDRQRGY